MSDKVVVGTVCMGTCAPLSASSGKQTRMFYDEDSSADGGGVGDRFVAAGCEFLACLDLPEEGVNWRRGHQSVLIRTMLVASWSSSISP